MSYTPDKWTDSELEALEKRIAKVYKEAEDDLTKEVNEYFAKFKVRDKEMKDLVDAGEMTNAEYMKWRSTQMGRGQRFEALRDKVAERYTKANEVANAYVNDLTPSIYSLNRNYEAYTIEKAVGNCDFTMFDESTVRRLLVEQPDIMPYYPPERALQRGIDLAYGKDQITKRVTSGIIRGISPGKIANELMQGITTMNRESAVRAARTGITAAENAGRLDGYIAAEKMGIKIRRRWVCVKDSRTRLGHGMADGQIVEGTKTPFIVDGEKMMFPGDTSLGASGYNIYNCRCRTRTVEKDGIEAEPRQMRVRDPETGEEMLVNEMTYSDWVKWKETGVQPIVKAKARASFTPAKTIEEATQYAQRFVSTHKTKYSGYVDYGKIDVDVANDINEVLTEIFDAYEPPPMTTIQLMNMREKKWQQSQAEAAYGFLSGDLYINGKWYKNAKTIAAHGKEYTELMERVMPKVPEAIKQLAGKTDGVSLKKQKYYQALLDTGRTNVFGVDTKGTTIHEMGHMLDATIFKLQQTRSTFDLKGSMKKYAGKISAYATDSSAEYVAESFAAYWKGEVDILDPELVKIFEKGRKR